jgi:hypothetical protein
MKESGWYVTKDGKINPNGLYINQNYIEQAARGAVKGEKGKVTDTNITDENLTILLGLFKREFQVQAEMDLAKFRETYSKNLILNNGSLSGALCSMYVELVKPDASEQDKKAAKEKIDETLWPAWANAVTQSFLQHNELPGDRYFVLTAKVSATSQTLHSILETLNSKYAVNAFYLEGKGSAEFLGKDGEVPYVISSGEYTNHSNEATKIAKKLCLPCGTKDQIEELFIGTEVDKTVRQFRDEFRKYIIETVDKRKQSVQQTANENRTKKIDVYQFVQKQQASGQFLTKEVLDGMTQSVVPQPGLSKDAARV